ncbi:hypothetical protein BGX28_003094 [Mortierella sp. GBA30]|nr:hypothetical protein BGX28_003094 [Mortierella sp. GBA30]
MVTVISCLSSKLSSIAKLLSPRYWLSQRFHTRRSFLLLVSVALFMSTAAILSLDNKQRRITPHQKGVFPPPLRWQSRTDGINSRLDINRLWPLQQQQEEEAQDPLFGAQHPFEKVLFEDEEDQDQYLLYIPFAGLGNQFYGLIRSLEVARALGRTLIIPPITSSVHDKSGQNQPWSRFLDLDRFMSLQETKVIELHQLKDAERSGYDLLQCHITCGFGSRRTIEHTAHQFLKQWKFNLTLTPFLDDDGHNDNHNNDNSNDHNDHSDHDLETIVSGLQQPHLRDRKFICISNTFRITAKGRNEWSDFGRHLHFTDELESFVQEFLDRTLGFVDDAVEKTTDLMTAPLPPPPSSSSPSPFRHQFIVVHARRGDFLSYCNNRFSDSGQLLNKCLPSTTELAARVSGEQARLNPTMDPSKNLPVFVATNEVRPEELQSFADLGWRRLDHIKMRTVEFLGVFGPMMVDQVLMAHADVLVSSQFSTFSRVGAKRQRDWHGHTTDYM